MIIYYTTRTIMIFILKNQNLGAPFSSNLALTAIKIYSNFVSLINKKM